MNSSRGFLTAAVVFIACSAAAGPTEPAVGIIRFRIVDAFTGGPLQGVIELRRSGNDQPSRTVPAGGVAMLTVPYGTYIAEVSSRGFVRQRRPITVDGPSKVVSVGLVLSAPVDGALPPEVSGSIVANTRPVHITVKLVALYSDLTYESMVSDDFTFLFRQVQLGSYLLIAAGGGSVTSEVIRVRGRESGINLRLQ